MTSIGIVIVSFNTCELLRGCLESLRGCTLPLRVVVVENGSRDGSAAMVRAYFPEIELIALEQNVGFAAGTNVGMRLLLDKETRRQGDGEQGSLPISLSPCLLVSPSPGYVLLLNPDTVVHSGAIEALAAFLDAHPRVGAVGPRLLNSDGSVQPAAFRFPTLAMTLLDLFPPGQALPGRLYNSWWHGRYPHEQCADAPFPIDHPLGACILARRAVVEQVGLLDERFFMYAEEIDWCYRIREAGWAIWQEPRARVTHVGGAATSQFRSRMLIALYESRLRFFRKHYSRRFVRWHMRIVRAGMLRAALLDWRDYARGHLSGDALRARLWTYGKVSQL
ncbi:MAG: glycosyltransferase [Chloroflexota bacterium]|nr:glycosyltransferase [Chloroflexota bacterium]